MYPFISTTFAWRCWWLFIKSWNQLYRQPEYYITQWSCLNKGFEQIDLWSSYFFKEIDPNTWRVWLTRYQKWEIEIWFFKWHYSYDFIVILMWSQYYTIYTYI
jgi:hypothetical protein